MIGKKHLSPYMNQFWDLRGVVLVFTFLLLFSVKYSTIIGPTQSFRVRYPKYTHPKIVPPMRVSKLTVSSCSSKWSKCQRGEDA